MIANNLAELFFKQAEKSCDKTAVEYRLRRNEPYRTISWSHLTLLVKETAYGLIELGLKKGDKIAILSSTRYEWIVFDLAVLSCGGIVVPIYPTLGNESVNYILNDSRCEIVVSEDKGQLQKVRSQWEALPSVRYTVVIEDLGDLPVNDPRIISFHKLRDKGKLNFSKDPFLVENHLKGIDVYDIATIIYTSGTTGPPKGVMLTHKNILSVLEVLPKILPLKSSDKFLSFLPLSHVFERVGSYYNSISNGTTISYCSNIDQIGAALKDSGATLMLVVPRILEKIYAKLNVELNSLGGFKKDLFNWAVSVRKKYLSNKTKKQSQFLLFFDFSTDFLQFVADKLFFSAVRKKLAPKLKYFISGGAPLSKEIAEFFYLLGIPILEGYGLTETSAPATVNSLRGLKIGTVGKPLPNVDLKIAQDGEILIKGPNIFLGYFKNDVATKESFIDNWFKTGDIGFIDEEGFLVITDRKKDIIVNSAGKNISPQNIESSLKLSPFINNAVVIGDKRKYLSCLLTLDSNSVLDYIKKKDLKLTTNISDLHNDPSVIKLIDEEVKFRTAGFADYEQIRRFTILPRDFSIESDEITPTLKVKRKFIQEKYKDLIEKMYPKEVELRDER